MSPEAEVKRGPVPAPNRMQLRELKKLGYDGPKPADLMGAANLISEIKSKETLEASITSPGLLGLPEKRLDASFLRGLEAKGCRFTICPPKDHTYTRKDGTTTKYTGKSPQGLAWAKKGGANYALTDPDLIKAKKRGWNMGLVCGTGGVIAFDADELARLEELGVIAKLPATVEIESRPDHRHRYYICPELKKKFPFYDPVKTEVDKKSGKLLQVHLGEVLGPGGHVVLPGSIHPKAGTTYHVVPGGPESMAELTLEDLRDICQGLEFSRSLNVSKSFDEAVGSTPRATKAPHQAQGDSLSDQVGDIRRVLEVYEWEDVRRSGDEWYGAPPNHSSDSGDCFQINIKKNIWHCKGCDVGGDIASLIAMFEGLITCEEASQVSKDTALFKKILAAAQERGLVEAEGGGFELADFCSEGIEGAWKFSPSKTSKNLLEKMVLTTDKGGVLRRFDGRIYRDDGADVVSDTVYSVAGDRVTKTKVVEVLDRLGVKLRLNPVVFNPCPELLGVKNGVLDCKTGEFRDYRAEDLITDSLPITFDPAARCPAILKFIESITPDYDDRVTLIDIIASGAYRKALYYIAFLTGRGGSGSSTCVQLLQAFYGDESTEAVPLKELLSSRFALGALENSRFCIGSEEDVGEKGTSVVKKISGGDWISSDVKNKNRTRFRGWTKLLFTTNEIPRFKDETWSFIRRFVEVKLPYRFLTNPDPEEPGDKLADPHIIEKLTTDSELSGLLNLVAFRLAWIIKKRQIYRREGMHEEYKEQVDSIITFFDRFCSYRSESLEDRVPIKDLHASFEKWCSLIVGNTVDVRRFGRYAKEFCKGRDSLNTTIKGKPVTIYQGLRFDEVRFDSEVRGLEDRLRTGLNGNRTGLKTGLKNDPLISLTGLTGLDIGVDYIEHGVCTLWESVVEVNHAYVGEEELIFNPVNLVSDSKRRIFNPVANPVNPFFDSRQTIANPVTLSDSGFEFDLLDPVFPEDYLNQVDRAANDADIREAKAKASFYDFVSAAVGVS